MVSITDVLEKFASSGKTVSQVWKNVVQILGAGLELGPNSFPLYLYQFLPLAYSSTLKMEAAGFSKMVAMIYHTTRRHSPEVILCHENLKSHIYQLQFHSYFKIKFVFH
jgi:hypothetical protein